MASKTIHICDRCKSFILKDDELFPLSIKLDFPEAAGGQKRVDINQGGKISIGPRIRVVCMTCAEEISETYLLKHRDTSEVLFKEQVAEDLQKKIQQYNNLD